MHVHDVHAFEYVCNLCGLNTRPDEQTHNQNLILLNKMHEGLIVVSEKERTL